MFEISLLDGSIKKIEKEMSIIEFAKMLSTSLAKKTVGALFDGVQVDVSYIIKKIRYFRINNHR